MNARSLEVLAVAGVGVAGAGHGLGLVFHRLESRKWIERDVIFHGFCLLYLAVALYNHMKKAND